MATVLHILKSEPDETVAELIEASSLEETVAVVGLYQDEITGSVINWYRLVDDIFTYDRVILPGKNPMALLPQKPFR